VWHTKGTLEAHPRVSPLGPWHDLALGHGGAGSFRPGMQDGGAYKGHTGAHPGCTGGTHLLDQDTILPSVMVLLSSLHIRAHPGPCLDMAPGVP